MEGLSEGERRRQIRNFLIDFKELMGQGRYYVMEHVKNLKTLIDLGMTIRQRDELLLSLSLENYSEGPLRDAYKPGNLWVFGKSVEGIEVYIKLKIITLPDGDENAVCISFHTSEFPMNYPYGSQ